MLDVRPVLHGRCAAGPRARAVPGRPTPTGGGNLPRRHSQFRGQVGRGRGRAGRHPRSVEVGAWQGASGTLSAAASLASTHCLQGRLSEAEELQGWVLESSRRVNGKEDPHTLAVTANLAGVHSNQGRDAEAEELQIVVLEAKTRLQGKECPATLKPATNLAVTYSCSQQGKHAGAEEWRAKTLAVPRRVLGAEHPDTLRNAAKLAVTYTWAGGGRGASGRGTSREPAGAGGSAP